MCFHARVPRVPQTVGTTFEDVCGEASRLLVPAFHPCSQSSASIRSPEIPVTRRAPTTEGVSRARTGRGVDKLRHRPDATYRARQLEHARRHLPHPSHQPTHQSEMIDEARLRRPHSVKCLEVWHAGCQSSNLGNWTVPQGSRTTNRCKQGHNGGDEWHSQISIDWVAAI
jgi:hypothetical protein